jgi:hypothetical protein
VIHGGPVSHDHESEEKEYPNGRKMGGSKYSILVGGGGKEEN